MDMATFQQQFLTAMGAITQLTAKVDRIPTLEQLQQHIHPLQQEQAQQAQRVAVLERRGGVVERETGQLVRLADRNDESYKEAILLQTPSGSDPDRVLANVNNFVRLHFPDEGAQAYN